jgi:Fe-S-cluster-containing dehydrogenase component
MKKWNLIIDVDNCTNCNACVLACSDEYYGNEFPGYAAEMPKHEHKWINIKQKVRGTAPVVDVAYLPIMCQHCDNAPCIEAAENNAVSKRPDGIVIIDPEKAKGQKQLVESCPYDAIFWNEEKQLPQHWIFDAHLLDQGWKEPRAAQVCATAAIRAVKIDDSEMEAIAARDDLERFHPEYETKSRVWYKNLHRYTTSFVAGSLEAEKDGVVDCVEGASVELIKDSQPIAQTTSDNYGDFKFDRLEDNSGKYQIKISCEGFDSKKIDIELGISNYIGAVPL